MCLVTFNVCYKLTYLTVKNRIFSDKGAQAGRPREHRGWGSAHEETQALCDVGSGLAVTPARQRGAAVNPPQTAVGTCSLALQHLPQPFLEHEPRALAEAEACKTHRVRSPRRPGIQLETNVMKELKKKKR